MRLRRRLWFDIHSWLGLKLSILMSFILLTGTLATISHELDWLVHSEMRVVPRDTAPVTWGALYEAARDYSPALKVVALSAPIDTWFAAQAIVLTDCGERLRLHLDPYIAQVNGVTGWLNIQRFFRMMHRHLMMPTRIGVPIVSLLSLLLIGSLVTGLVVYKKWWRGFFMRPRSQKPRRFWGDMHRLGGLWAIWFVLLIGLTGFWYLLESLGFRAPSLPRVEIPDDVSQTTLDGEAIDRMVRLARDKIDGLQVSRIRFPAAHDELVRIQGQAGAVLVRPRANQAVFDQHGRLLASHRGEQLSIHQRISEMADPLHFGNFAGFAVKLIWFVFGLLLTMLSLTGIYIYALRIIGKDKMSVYSGSTGYSVKTTVWKGMGGWKFPAIALVGIGFLLTPYTIGLLSIGEAPASCNKVSNTVSAVTPIAAGSLGLGTARASTVAGP